MTTPKENPRPPGDRGQGRKKLPEAQHARRRKVGLTPRFEPDERERLDKAAEKAGDKSAHAYLVRVVLEAIERDLGPKKEPSKKPRRGRPPKERKASP